MKKLFVIVAATAIALAAVAQTPTPTTPHPGTNPIQKPVPGQPNPNPGQTTPTVSPTPDHTVAPTLPGNQSKAPAYDAIVMRNGKVYTMKGTVTTPMSRDEMLGGTRVMPDGRITYTDGTTGMLLEGDKILPSGKLMKASDVDKIKRNMDMPKEK